MKKLCHNRCFSPCPAIGLSSPQVELNLDAQTASLQRFEQVMRKALATVTSLHITNDISRYHTQSFQLNSSLNSSNSNRYAKACDQVSQGVPWMLDISKLLAAACPNLVELGVGGRMGAECLQHFALHCTQLTRLEAISYNFHISNLELAASKLQTPLIPELACLDLRHMFCPPDIIPQLSQLLVGPALTHLLLGRNWLAREEDWLLLPAGLQELHCKWMLDPSFRLPHQLQLGRLECLHFSYDNVVHITQLGALTSLLRAAPALRLLTDYDELANAIAIETFTPLDLHDMLLLHQRMSSGLTMNGVALQCSERPSTEVADVVLVPMATTLSRMPVCSTFKFCRLSSEEEDGRSGSLMEVGRMFPNIKSMRLYEEWLDADLSADMDFNCMELLHVDALVSGDALSTLVSRMPRLTSLQHRSWPWKRGFENRFRTQLQAAERIRADDQVSCAAGMGEWNLLVRTKLLTVWRRKKMAVRLASAAVLET